MDVPDPEAARTRLLAAEGEIRRRVDEIEPGMARRGGGARGVEVRILHAPLGRLSHFTHRPQLLGPLQGLPLMQLDLGCELALEGILVR